MASKWEAWRPATAHTQTLYLEAEETMAAVSKVMRVIDLNWSPRRRIEYDENSDCYRLDKDEYADLQHSGLYCLYGAHPSYGREVLLYIGMTEGSFRARLSKHLEGRFWYHENLSYSLGTLDKAEWCDSELKICESILIAANKPVLNRQSVDAASAVKEYLDAQQASGAEVEHYLVRNWYFADGLQRESSSDYWYQL